MLAKHDRATHVLLSRICNMVDCREQCNQLGYVRIRLKRHACISCLGCTSQMSECLECRIAYAANQPKRSAQAMCHHMCCQRLPVALSCVASGNYDPPFMVTQLFRLTYGDSMFAKTIASTDRLQANFTIAASFICQNPCSCCTRPMERLANSQKQAISVPCDSRPPSVHINRFRSVP